MHLATTLYVGNLTTLTDARYCAGMGVQLLGFPVDPKQENFLTEAQFKEIASWLAGVELVGEFAELDQVLITDTAQALGLDYVAGPAASALTLKPEVPLPLIKRLTVFDQEQPERLMERCAALAENSGYILLEDPSSTLKPDSLLDVLTNLCSRHSILLGFGINSENALELITQIKPAGLAVMLHEEAKPGCCTFEDLADLLESLDMEA